MSHGANPVLEPWSGFDIHALEQRILARLRHDRRVPWFVLASALLHAAIVLLAAPPSWLHPEPPAEPPPLSIRLDPPKPPPVPKPLPAPTATPQAAPLRRTEAPVRPQPMLQPTPTAPADTPVLAPREAAPPPPREVVSAPPPPPVAVPPAPRIVDDSALLDEYSRRLSDLVGRNKQYPAIARMRGWQGTAELEVRIAPDGSILGAKVLRSSGHELLDRQALEMVEQIGRFPPFPQSREQPVTVRLPVIFKLVAQ